ncbi:MAG TPA: ABC-type transport auxiliary lipoprotein family protein [Hyphomicrobiales bacterium]|nr:ABC-type transport auxiliary lipoprotein family protein [Hyphomicrobiales bacterium]
MRLAVAAAVAAMAAGCALLVPAPTPVTYDLMAPTNVGPRSGSVRGVLVVPAPTALQILDSQRIVVRSSGGQITYIANSQWPDRLTSLVQSRIIEAFENAGQQRAVGRPSDRLEANYDLVSDIRTFDVVVGGNGAAAEVSIAAKIVSDPGGRVVAARVFSATAPVRSVDGQGAAAGLQQALRAVLDDIVRWADQKI